MCITLRLFIWRTLQFAGIGLEVFNKPVNWLKNRHKVATANIH